MRIITLNEKTRLRTYAYERERTMICATVNAKKLDPSHSFVRSFDRAKESARASLKNSRSKDETKSSAWSDFSSPKRERFCVFFKWLDRISLVSLLLSLPSLSDHIYENKLTTCSRCSTVICTYSPRPSPKSSRLTSTQSSVRTRAVASPRSSRLATKRTPNVKSSTADGRC